MFVAEDPRNRLSTADLLLEAIEMHTHVAWWMNTKDGSKGRNKPRPVGLMKDRRPKPGGRTVEEYKQFLALPRKEVEDAN